MAILFQHLFIRICLIVWRAMLSKFGTAKGEWNFFRLRHLFYYKRLNKGRPFIIRTRFRWAHKTGNCYWSYPRDAARSSPRNRTSFGDSLEWYYWRHLFAKQTIEERILQELKRSSLGRTNHGSPLSLNAQTLRRRWAAHGGTSSRLILGSNSSQLEGLGKSAIILPNLQNLIS